jgi:hypothetical protein
LGEQHSFIHDLDTSLVVCGLPSPFCSAFHTSCFETFLQYH